MINGVVVNNNLMFDNKIQDDRFVVMSDGVDPNTILDLYSRYCTACVDHLTAGFAIAVWDKKLKRLFLARDRLGIKPLYYYEHKGDLFFSSKITGLPAQSKLNSQALLEYVTFQFCLGDKTLFEEVKKVPAGHYFLYSENLMYSYKYWGIDTFEKKRVNLVEVLQDIIPDIPHGIYLSGGLDSSIIAGVGNINYAFTGRYEEYDETEFASAVSGYIGIDHIFTSPNKRNFPRVLPLLIRALGEPMAGPGIFGQYFVSQIAPRYTNKILSGEGGDELFGGYMRHRLATGKDAPKNYADMVKNLPTSDSERYYSFVCRNDTYDLFNEFDAVFDDLPGTFLNKMTMFDLTAGLPALLHVDDTVNRLHGVECNAPFLDNRFVEAALSIPVEERCGKLPTKHLLRETFKDYIPEKIYNRRDKMGFPVPLAEWYNEEGDTRDFVQSHLSDLAGREFIPVNIPDKMKPHQRDIWGWLCLELWIKEFGVLV